MDLLLQKDLPHQQYAVDAVTKVFDNVAIGVPSFYYMNPLINILDSNCHIFPPYKLFYFS